LNIRLKLAGCLVSVANKPTVNRSSKYFICSIIYVEYVAEKDGKRKILK